MSYICEYCNTNFTRIYTLKQHQLKAKYCLALQRKHISKYICESCEKEFSRKDSLKRHQQTCTIVRERIDEKIQEYMSEMKNLFEQLADKESSKSTATNVNRNFVANLQPVVEEDIEAIALEYLTIDDIKKGVDGFVSFVLDYPLGKNVICTDKSRKKLQYKDAEGYIVNDAGGVQLSKTFFKAINPRNQELIKNEYDQIYTKVQDIIAREAAHDENVTDLMMEAMNIQTLAAKCEEIAMGGDNEVRVNFINRLIKQL